MKKINFEIIKKVDYLLVFIAAVIGLIASLVNLISEIFPIRYSQPAHIEIIDSKDEEAVSKITESIDFLEKMFHKKYNTFLRILLYRYLLLH